MLACGRLFCRGQRLYQAFIDCSFTFGLRLMWVLKMIFSVHSAAFIFSLYYATTKAIQRFENIVKSPNDTRLYRGLKLENELKVLIISDPTTDNSAASLSVNAGSFNETNNIPGLAHLLEHMLFKCSRKYPHENEYQNFVINHAGYVNAETHNTQTNFFFHISSDNLVPALDRFAQFFLEPLMEESAIEREVMVVNSEYEKNTTMYWWRVDQLIKSLSKRDHPFNNFTTGNLETLYLMPKSQGISVRDRLLEFHSKWYSANLMSLVVLGKESLNELEEIIINLFSELKNKNAPKIIYDEHPYGPQQLKRKFYVVPIKDTKKLKISFSTPDVNDQYKTLPQDYLRYLIGHKGSGSLYSTLRNKELCNNLAAVLLSRARGFSFFNIYIDLTEIAVERIDEIITIIFQYIKLIQTRGIQKWIFEETKRIKETAFLFKDKPTPLSYVRSLSSMMDDYYPFEDILTVNYLFDEWEPECIENLLSYLTPNNMIVVITSKTFERIANQTERWYGTKYNVEPIPDDLIQRWKDVELSESLYLPAPNKFIPENFDLYPRDENEPNRPYVLHESSISRIWFKHNDAFKLPKLDVRFEIFSPVSTVDHSSRNLSQLFVNLIKETSNEYTHAANSTNLKWNICTTCYGFYLELSGFSEKLPLLLEKIISQMTNFNFDEKRFQILKESYIRVLQNFEIANPFFHGNYYFSYLLNEHFWDRKGLLDATNDLEYGHLKKFVQELFSNIYFQGLIHGNCDKKKAMDIINILESSFKSSFGVLPQQLLPGREVKIDDGHHFLLEVFNNYQSGSCYYVYFQCSSESPFNNVILELFLQIVVEPCSNILRTQEHLGYIVDTKIRRCSGSQGLVVLIQSEKHPLYLNSRVEEFLRTFHKILEKMTDEEFEVYKTSLANKKLKKPVHLTQQTNKYWEEIRSRMYNFDRDIIEVRKLRKLKKPDIMNFFEEFLQEGSRKRRKLSVHDISTLTNPERPTDISDKDIRITDVSRFKKFSNYVPLPEPYIKITPLGTKPK